MSDPTTVKRGRGRPRKDGQPAQASKPKNPDCEPATKGYVKCMIRTTRDHTHGQDIKSGSVIFGVIFGTAIFLIAIFSGDKELYATFTIPSALFTLGLSLVWWDLARTSDDYTTERISESEPECLKKYIAPEEIQRICEVFNKPKKECEE